jgi:hypothetical protein
MFSFAALIAGVGAETMDRPSGIKIGQHMTLKPYVSVSATYDSNVGARAGRRSANQDEEDDVTWSVNPGLGLAYDAENWSLLLNAYYTYHDYCKNHKNLGVTEGDNHSYGQDLRWQWSNSSGNERGWTLMVMESFRQITMADDFTAGDGNSYNADRRQLQFAAAVQRRFTETIHGDVNTSYYLLDYNGVGNGKYASLYGWQRWSVGGELGYSPTKWTDFLVSVGYQGYEQDNVKGNNAASRYLSSNSDGLTFQAGIGSYATERISYRLLAGWSRFEYGDASSNDGFVYTATGRWQIGQTWQMMLLGSSYYQPSERTYGASTRVDSLSWGLVKTLVRGKLRATLDLSYRHELHEYALSSGDYDIDFLTGRIGLDYTLNRFAALFGYFEYQKATSDESVGMYNYDYDRWRVTTGIRFTY